VGTLLGDGKVLVSGGLNVNSVSASELFDPATNTWSSTGDLNIGRSYHTGVMLADFRVLVAGGFTDTDYEASAELFDGPPRTFAQWQQANFTTAQLSDTSFSGPSADPYHTGKSNLLAYASDLPASYALTPAGSTVSANSTSLYFTYTRLHAAPDVTYSLEQSIDLRSWSDASFTSEVVANSVSTDAVRANVAIAGDARLFLRLRVEMVP
jgi:hypothetical protein